jgi:coproporphyrinogen III oxidase-like Fe-S oxidoreductase
LLEEGISPARFAARYGAPIDQFYAAELRDGLQRGLLEITPERVRLTPKGHFLSNQALMLFVE